MAEQQSSRYHFIQWPRGFRIEGINRNPVTVDLLDYSILVNQKSFGFYTYYSFSRYIAKQLMANSIPPEDKLEYMFQDWHYIPVWVRKWAVTQTAKVIGKRVHFQWRRLLTLVDPDVLAVHRSVYAATIQAAEVTYDPALYLEKHLVRDIINYRAGAIAALIFDDLNFFGQQIKAISILDNLPSSSETKALKALARDSGVDMNFEVNTNCYLNRMEITPAERIEKLINWRDLFSCSGKSYRSLDRTLMNLPGGIPAGYLSYLCTIELPRPITDRVELLCLLTYRSVYEDNTRSKIPNNTKVVINATRKQILEAMSRVAIHTHNDLDPRKSYSFLFFSSFINDYPEIHNGNIIGLAEKAIKWHRRQGQDEITKPIERLGEDTEAAIPPIPLPVHPGIKFLAKVSDIGNEGLNMGHCIATYAKDAVDGHCHLFHIEHNGELATVQVDFKGHVVQAHGPGNKQNQAVNWGKRMLRCWGQKFPTNPVKCTTPNKYV